jgi:hypothetical protein
LIKIRKLLNEQGIPTQSGEELAKAGLLIIKLKTLSEEAGGDAPRPNKPNQDVISGLEQHSGNSLILELFTNYDSLTTLAKTWSDTATQIKQKMPVWLQLNELIVYAKELSIHETLNAEIQAILQQRSLLSEPDHVAPLLNRIAEGLRQALNAKLKAYEDEYKLQISSLGADVNWQKLDVSQQSKLIAEHHIVAPKNIALSTADELSDALSECDLQRWIERSQALRTRFDSVRLEATKLLQPNVVQVNLPRRTLNSPEEVNVWLAEAEALLMDKVSKGPIAL